jgi:phospholipase C
MRSLGLGVALLAAVCACSSDDDPPAGPTAPPGPAEWNREVTPPSDSEAEQSRAACAYQAGMLPAETQGASHPSGADIPVDTIVVVMMENRSFDHYFQKLTESGGPEVDVAPADFSNPDPDGVPVTIAHETQYCFVDTDHGYGGSRRQVNGGAMDGFVVTNEGNHELPAGGTPEMLSGARAMRYYDQTDIPFYYWLAGEFALGERYFASVLGPTWPNRMYLMAATSFGLGQNVLASADKTLMDYLDLRQVQWKMYYSTTPTYAMFIEKYLAVTENAPEHMQPIEQYYIDAANGTLPPVAFVEPGVGRESVGQDDEHPPAIMQIGQHFAAGVIDALTKSPQWSRSALFLTYDEHGGLYDHVVPPQACPPDDLSEPLGNGELPTFETLGIRVPFFVVSPYAKKRYVSQRVYDHTSIVRFIAARFVMPALTGRDANAEAPWDMFDFAGAPNATPPAITMPVIDEEKLAACEQIFGE